MRLLLYDLWFIMAAVSSCGTLAVFTVIWQTYRSNRILRKVFMPIGYLLAGVFFCELCAMIRSYNIPIEGITEVGIVFGLVGHTLEGLISWIVFMMLLARNVTPEVEGVGSETPGVTVKDTDGS